MAFLNSPIGSGVALANTPESIQVVDTTTTSPVDSRVFWYLTSTSASDAGSTVVLSRSTRGTVTSSNGSTYTDASIITGQTYDNVSVFLTMYSTTGVHSTAAGSVAHTASTGSTQQTNRTQTNDSVSSNIASAGTTVARTLTFVVASPVVLTYTTASVSQYTTQSGRQTTVTASYTYNSTTSSSLSSATARDTTARAYTTRTSSEAIMPGWSYTETSVSLSDFTTAKTKYANDTDLQVLSSASSHTYQYNLSMVSSDASKTALSIGLGATTYTYLHIAPAVNTWVNTYTTGTAGTVLTGLATLKSTI